MPPSLVGVFASAPEATLARIRETLATRSTPTHRACAYEIAALSLGAHAESWIREQWSTPELGTLLTLAQASARCLPAAEGLERVLGVLDSLPPEQRHEHVSALSWFAGSRTLDGLEALVHAPLTDTWGRVAALCGLDWSRARAWLDAGRPLSLVCLDALAAFLHYDTLLLRKMAPKLAGAPDAAEVREYLARYAERDPVPRVKRAAGYVLANLEALLGGRSTQS